MPYSKVHTAAALIASLLFLGLNQPAAAITDAENDALQQQCTIYASNAQNAGKYVTKLGCYPDSGTTSTDYTAHYNFCYQGFINGTMDWGFLEWEDAKRSAMVRSCGYCTGANTPPGVTPFAKASTDRISNKNIYHCTNDHSRGGPDYSTLAWSDDPKDRRKACLQIFLGDPGIKSSNGRQMQVQPLSADVLEAALEEQLEGSCPAIYAHPEQVRNTCWNFSTKARMIGNWVYNYEGDACFKGQPLGWWKNGSYYDWCIRTYDRVGSDSNPLTLEQANSEIESQKEVMEAVVDACQAKHNKPIIDDMGNECTPEAHAAGTCVFNPTAQVTAAAWGATNTRAYAPPPPPPSYNTGVGDITNLKPPPKIGSFTPGDGTGSGTAANNPGAGGPGSGGFDTVHPGGPNGPNAPGGGTGNQLGSGGPGGPGSGGFDTVHPGGSNGPYAPGAGGSGKGTQLGSGGFDTVHPGGSNGPYAPGVGGSGKGTQLGSGGPGSGGFDTVHPGGPNGPYAPGAGGSGKGNQPGGSGPMPGVGGGSGGPGGGGISSAMGQPAGNKSSTFIPPAPGTNVGSGSPQLGQPVNKPSKFIHAPSFPGTGTGTQNIPRLSLASPHPNSTNNGTVNSSRRNYRGFHGAYRGYRARVHRNTARRSASHGGTRHARRSDIRLKHDIALLGRLDNGLGLYRFSYNGSNDVYVGVMAQEVETIMPEAVVRGKDGYLRVYYDRLGLRLQTWRAWEAEGQKIPTLIRSSR